jgi:hypothetical protein
MPRAAQSNIPITTDRFGFGMAGPLAGGSWVPLLASFIQPVAGGNWQSRPK